MEQPPPKETRVPVNLRIKFRSETIEQFVDRYAVDVSRGGIFIRTREPLAVGTQLKFDFQLQDTTPLMAGEGTVVWIREHDPNRTGVTPGMGVRFDKLTPASQPVLDRILVDKARRETSGPTAAGASATSTTSGKSGAGPLPVRRPSSTFSAMDPGALGVPAASQSTPGTNPGLGAPLHPVGVSASGFGASPGSSPSLKPLVAGAGPASSGSGARPLPAAPGAGKAAGPSSGAMPALESQSALGRLATGPNLSAFAPLAPRSKSPVPLPPLTPSKAPAAGDASGPASATSGTPAVPTPVEDSERTQIADSLPDFSGEPTHVGSQSQDVADLMAGRTATISATARRSPTPAPDPKPSLDVGIGSGPALAAPTASLTAAPIESSVASALRTTSPDGSANALSSGGSGLGRLSASQPVVAGPLPGAGSAATADSDLARTVPAAARMSAITSTMRADTPQATPRTVVEKKRPTVAIVVGVLVGAAAAAVIAFQMSRSGSHEPEAPAASASAPAAEPSAAPAPSANPGAAPAAAPAADNPAGEANPAEAAGKGAAAKPAEAVAPEAKPGEAKVAETKPSEAKPAEPAPVVAEPAPATKPGRKARLLAHKKGAPGTSANAQAALEAAAATGEDGAAAADAGNVARIISLPSGAEVLIDGQVVGKTPFIGKDIDPASPHALTIRKDGFETYEHMVSSSDWIKGKGNGQTLKQAVKLRKVRAAGEAEGADKKAEKNSEKSGEPAESAKTEPPPAAETP